MTSKTLFWRFIRVAHRRPIAHKGILEYLANVGVKEACEFIDAGRKREREARKLQRELFRALQEVLKNDYDNSLDMLKALCQFEVKR